MQKSPFMTKVYTIHIQINFVLLSLYFVTGGDKE